MKALIVGDLHAKIDNLQDTEILFGYIETVLLESKADLLVFTGDLYHTHSVLRQEIVSVLQKGFKKLNSIIHKDRIILIAGNHDGMSPTSVRVNALRQTLDEYTTVVDDENLPVHLKGSKFIFIPFIHNKEKFVQVANSAHVPGSILVCHGTFNGARYENGFYAPDGVDDSLLSYDFILSGHIHEKQQIGKVFFVGTPRAVNSSEKWNEANPKALHVFDDEDITNFSVYPTTDLMKCYWNFSVNENADSQLQFLSLLEKGSFKKKDKISVTVEGTDVFYKDFSEKYKGLGFALAHEKTEELQASSKLKSTANNIDQSFKEYVDSIFQDTKENKDKIWNKINKLRPQNGQSNII